MLHLLVRPESGTDLAAQLARTSFARDAPLTPVDLSWYGGVHVYSYSLLAPWIMAVVGVGLTGLFAAVAAAVLLARLLRDSERPVRASLLGAFFSVADVVSGRTTFALGAVAALAALVLLPRRRWSVAFAVLTGLLSPVAAAFLGFSAAVLVLHRRPGGWSLGFATTIPVVVLATTFPGGGIQPFSADLAFFAVAVAIALAVMTSNPMIRTGSLLYAAFVVFFAGHDDPFGSNVLRLELLVGASLLLATTRRHGVVVLVVCLGFLAWQLDPTEDDLRFRNGPSYQALNAQLAARHSQRVEVLAPTNHRESADVAERVPLARGWSRQRDFDDNPIFYADPLTAEEFVTWLHDNAVDHVAVPRRAPLDFGSRREAELLDNPVPGLEQVWTDRDWVLLAVRDPQPIADDVTVVSSGRTTLVLRSDAARETVVRVHWSRWLSLQGPGCLLRDGDRVRVRFSGPGEVTLGSGLRPTGHCS